MLFKFQKSALYPGLILAAVALLGIAIFVFLGPLMPFVAYCIFQAIFIMSAVYLLGISYGIVNDVIATGQSLDYFSKGHQSGFWAINSDDRFANAFAFGIVATWQIALPAAILFGIGALICNFFSLSFASFLLLVMIGAILLVLVTADIYARIKKHERLKQDSQDSIDNNLIYLHKEQVKNVKTNEQIAGWLSCNDRNTFGYIFMPLVGLGGFITYIILRALGVALPAIPLSFTLQAVLVGVLLAAFTIACIYLYFHHDNETEPHVINALEDDEQQQRTWAKTELEELAANRAEYDKVVKSHGDQNEELDVPATKGLLEQN